MAELGHSVVWHLPLNDQVMALEVNNVSADQRNEFR